MSGRPVTLSDRILRERILLGIERLLVEIKRCKDRDKKEGREETFQKLSHSRHGDPAEMKRGMAENRRAA